MRRTSEPAAPVAPRPQAKAPRKAQAQVQAQVQPQANADEVDAPRGSWNPITRLIDGIARKIHHGKHDPENPAGPNRITHERPFFESKGFAFGLEFGVTVSELHQVRRKKGVELIHVVNPDGSSNLEMVLGSKQLGHKQRVELQGPALNTSMTPGELPVGARFVGLGLTSDFVDKQASEAISYTFEVKATEKTAAHLAALAAPGAATAAVKLLGEAAKSGVGHAIAEVFSYAVPVVGGLIALSTARWAVKVCKNPKSTRTQKAFAVAHAVSDAVRIVFPLAGVLGNVGLVALAAGVGLYQARAAKAHPKTGPPAEAAPEPA